MSNLVKHNKDKARDDITQKDMTAAFILSAVIAGLWLLVGNKRTRKI